MRRAGFTLIELLIVLGILGVMALAIIPSFANMGGLQVSIAAKDSLRLMRYARRVAGQDDEEERKRESDTFTITVRANGTTRPFTMRVYERDSDSKGDTLSFDFLCAGTIGDD